MTGGTLVPKDFRSYERKVVITRLGQHQSDPRSVREVELSLVQFHDVLLSRNLKEDGLNIVGRSNG